MKENLYRGSFVGVDHEESRVCHIAAAVHVVAAGGGTGRDTPGPAQLAAVLGFAPTTAQRNW